jgi:chorismate mutase
MSVEQLESQVLALPLADRRAFTRWLDEHRDAIEQPSALVHAQESEVRQRLAEMEADPALRVPFAEADVEQMFKEIMDERAAKTSSCPR